MAECETGRMIPLVHDLRDETVLVFGGGPVGARRARTFAGEARVIVVSPAFADEDFAGAARIRAAPTPDDVPGWIERTSSALVLAATDDADLNAAVETAARQAGVLANRADRSGGDVVVPAIVRDGSVVVGISTSSRSPALAGELRRRIEAAVEDAGVLATATADLRAELEDRDVPPEARHEALRAVVGSERVWAAAGRGHEEVYLVARTVAEDALGADES